MFDLVIANAVIVSAANRYVPFIGSIAIEQGRLVYVGEKNFLPSEAYTYEDVEGDIVMPGLFNNHCHAEMSIMRGIGDGMTLLEQKQVFSDIDWFRNYCTDDERFAARQLTYCEALRFGTTFLNDVMYWSLGERAVDAMVSTGIRGALSEDVRPNFTNPDIQISPQKLKSFFHCCKTEGLVPVVAGIAEEDYSHERLKKICELRNVIGNSFYTCHLEETDWRMKHVQKKFNCTPIEVLNSYGMVNDNLIASHVVYASPRDIHILRDARAAVVNTPICEMKIADGVAPIYEMIRQGICVSLGTDGAIWNNSNDIFREMKAMLLLQTVKNGIRSINERDVLDMATINGAKTFHVEDRLGTLEQGKDADFIRISTKGFSMCPLRLGKYENVVSLIVNNATGGDVRDVYIHGKCIVKNGKILSVDAEKLRKHVNDSSCRISKQLEKLSIKRNVKNKAQ